MITIPVTYCQYPRIGLGLWYLTPPSTTFQLYRDGQFYWWRKSGSLKRKYRRQKRDKECLQALNNITRVISKTSLGNIMTNLETLRSII
jgi:hypothetical protein